MPTRSCSPMITQASYILFGAGPDLKVRIKQVEFCNSFCYAFPLPVMNIGITVYPTYGGSGIVGSELGRDLAERGHNVHFISSFLPTRLTELNERIHFHDVEMMQYPLFEHQPYDLALAT